MKAARCDVLLDQYAAALAAYLASGEERALEQAYAIGRKALNDGVGVLQMVTLHHRAILRALPKDSGMPPSVTNAIEVFFTECLSPFEMVHRGFREANAALRHLNQALETEVKRIAHALHDETGQLLPPIHYALEVAARNLPPRAADQLREVRGLLNQFGETLRQLSHELRPTVLDDLGLVPALQFLAKGFSKRVGVSLTVVGDGVGRLPSSVEIGLYRIVQEGLNNVARHARATGVSVRIQVEQARRVVRCSIRDDGVGFDASGVLARPGWKGLGLLGMRERAEALGGTLRIVSAPGQGAKFVVTIPLEG